MAQPANVGATQALLSELTFRPSNACNQLRTLPTELVDMYLRSMVAPTPPDPAGLEGFECKKHRCAYCFGGPWAHTPRLMCPACYATLWACVFCNLRFESAIVCGWCHRS